MSSLLNINLNLNLSLSSSSSPLKAKRKICPICDRSFNNGKAMGGHMRAHLAKLPLPVKPRPETLPTREETPVKTKPDSVNLKSDHCLTDDEVALCLLKLTTDKWPEGVRPDILFPLRRQCKGRGDFKSFAQEDVDVDVDVDVDEEEAEDVSFSVTRRVSSSTKKSPGGEYRCKTCPRVFRSSQALGGHRASHTTKRMKFYSLDSSSKKLQVHRSDGVGTIYKCPYCDKVFCSGQALGGHKKVHLSYLGTVTASKGGRNVPTTTKKKYDGVRNAEFDLNLPALSE